MIKIQYSDRCILEQLSKVLGIEVNEEYSRIDGLHYMLWVCAEECEKPSLMVCGKKDSTEKLADAVNKLVEWVETNNVVDMDITVIVDEFIKLNVGDNPPRPVFSVKRT